VKSTTVDFCHAMAQTVSPRPVTAENRVISRATPCVVCSGQSGVAVLFYELSIIIVILLLLLSERQAGKTWEPSPKQCLFSYRGTLDMEMF
jgi:hypothetical protein